MRCGEHLPELGARLATATQGLRTDYVEASAVSASDRAAVARELLAGARSAARRHADHLRAEPAALTLLGG